MVGGLADDVGLDNNTGALDATACWGEKLAEFEGLGGISLLTDGVIDAVGCWKEALTDIDGVAENPLPTDGSDAEGET